MKNNKTHILVVDDDNRIRDLLKEYLSENQYIVSTSENAENAKIKLTQFKFDLIVLDVMMPGQNGYELTKDIRKNIKTPIILLTAKGEVENRIKGLELGADDYICKPFSPKEVVARVKAVLRRSDPNYLNDFNENEFVVNHDAFSVLIKGKKLDLTPVEFRMLTMFVDHPGRVYNRDQILNTVFDDGRIVLDRTVDTHIKNLRQKLKSANPEKDYIRSIYGIGYSFE